MGIIEVNPLEMIPKKAEEEDELPPPKDVLEYLIDVGLGRRPYHAGRVAAAKEAAKYIHSRKAVVATINSNGYAEQLDSAMARSDLVRRPKLIDAPKEGSRPGRSPQEVSAERMQEPLNSPRSWRRF